MWKMMKRRNAAFTTTGDRIAPFAISIAREIPMNALPMAIVRQLEQ